MRLRKSQPAELTKNMEIKQRYRKTCRNRCSKSVVRPFDNMRKKMLLPFWKVMDLQHREGGLGFSIAGGGRTNSGPSTLVEYGYFSEK